MALNLKIARPTGRHPVAGFVAAGLLALFVLATLVSFSVFGFYYFKYRTIVDQRLSQPIFATTAKIYAAPREVQPARSLSVVLIANELRQAGYTPDGAAQP